HTRFSRDWSSDVCSSDLLDAGERIAVHDPLPWTRAQQSRADNYSPGLVVTFNRKVPGWAAGETAEVSRIEGGEVLLRTVGGERQIGRASCRERAEISVVA